MLKKTNQTTTTYEFADEYLIDIVATEGEEEPKYAAYIYRKNVEPAPKMWFAGAFRKHTSYEQLMAGVELALLRNNLSVIRDYETLFDDLEDEDPEYEGLDNPNNRAQECGHGHEEQANENGENLPAYTFIMQQAKCEHGHEHNIALVKDNTIKIETYRFDTELTIGLENDEDEKYDPNDFLVDVVEEADRYVAWIYHKDYTSKLITIGEKTENTTKEQFVADLLDHAMYLFAVFINNGMPMGKRTDRTEEQD